MRFLENKLLGEKKVTIFKMVLKAGDVRKLTSATKKVSKRQVGRWLLGKWPKKKKNTLSSGHRVNHIHQCSSTS